MVMDPEKIVESIQNLVSFPDAVLRANQLLDSPGASVEEIGEVINHDPALSARLLKLVNSAFYNFSAQIDTISRAITMIGTDELRSLIMASAVSQTFEKIPRDIIDMDKFWQRSVFCGLVAKKLALLSRVGHAESMFLTGLLHAVGQLVLLAGLPEQAKQILECAARTGRGLAEVELQTLGFTSPELGSTLLKSWQLPKRLWEPIGCQNQPEMAEEYATEARILKLALKLTDCVEPELKTDTPRDLSSLEDITLNGTKLTGEELGMVATAANFECFEVLMIINPGAMMIY